MTPHVRLRHAVRDAPLLSARILAWSVVLRGVKHVLPLPRLARLMWGRARGSSSVEQRDRIVRLTEGVPALRPLPSRDNCLERSLVAYRYLSRAGADPVLVSGVRRGEDGIEGHAWVLLEGAPIHDAPDALDGFVPVVRFGPGGRRL